MFNFINKEIFSTSPNESLGAKVIRNIKIIKNRLIKISNRYRKIKNKRYLLYLTFFNN